jgi:hypothetical protein
VTNVIERHSSSVYRHHVYGDADMARQRERFPDRSLVRLKPCNAPLSSEEHT